MDKHHGTPIVYDWWIDYDIMMVYAIVEWVDEKETNKKSNLFLFMKEYNDN